MDNRRQCTRHELIINFPVINRRTTKLCGYLLDIAPEGFQLLSERPFSEYEVLHARIVKDTSKGNRDGIAVDGVCRWSKPDVNKRFFRSGFQISDEFGRDAEEIIRLICTNRV